MLRTEEAFFDAFFGVLLAGGVPVPIYPPFRRDRIEEYAQRQVGILDNAEARALITFPEAERVAGLLRSRVPSLRHVTTVDRSLAQERALMPLPHLRRGGRRADPVHLGQHRRPQGGAALATPTCSPTSARSARRSRSAPTTSP